MGTEIGTTTAVATTTDAIGITIAGIDMMIGDTDRGVSRASTFKYCHDFPLRRPPHLEVWWVRVRLYRSRSRRSESGRQPEPFARRAFDKVGNARNSNVSQPLPIPAKSS